MLKELKDIKMAKEALEQMVREIDPVNARYILKNGEILREWEYAEKYADKGLTEIAEDINQRIRKKIAGFGEKHLVPSNAKVGDGATVVFWTDRQAGTIVKVTKCSITVRRDKATLDPDFRPDFIPGGFCGTVVNQHEQSYTYEPDPEGREYTFRWSEKYQSYGRRGHLRAIKGRHEFYDYNF